MSTGVGYGLGGTVPGGKVWGYSPGGVQSQEVGSGGLVGGMALPSPVDRMTDACENIAFPQLRWRVVNIGCSMKKIYMQTKTYTRFQTPSKIIGFD